MVTINNLKEQSSYSEVKILNLRKNNNLIKDTESSRSWISYNDKAIIIIKFLVSLEQTHNKKILEQTHNKKIRCRDCR